MGRHWAPNHIPAHLLTAPERSWEAFFWAGTWENTTFCFLPPLKQETGNDQGEARGESTSPNPFLNSFKCPEDAKHLSHCSCFAGLLIIDCHFNLEICFVENREKNVWDHTPSGSSCSSGSRRDLWNVRLRVVNERIITGWSIPYILTGKPSNPLFPWIITYESPLDFHLDEAVLFWSRKHNKTLSVLDIKYCIILLYLSKDTWMNTNSVSKWFLVRICFLFFYILFVVCGSVFFLGLFWGFLGVLWVFCLFVSFKFPAWHSHWNLKAKKPIFKLFLFSFPHT